MEPGWRLLLCVALIAALALGASGKADPCRTYSSKGLLKPSSGSVRDTIFVGDAFDAEDVSVQLDVSHRRVGALQISLEAHTFAGYRDGGVAGGAAGGKSIVLKTQGLGRMGHDMYHTTFSDAAGQAFPPEKDAAPFTAAYRPTQRMHFLLDGDSSLAGEGGSQGAWVLRVDDLAPNPDKRQIFLNGWTLRLCEANALVNTEERAQEQAPSPSPAQVPLPAASPSPEAPAPSPSPRPSSPAPSPSPLPSPAASPAPAVTAASGPVEQLPALASQLAAAAAATPAAPILNAATQLISSTGAAGSPAPAASGVPASPTSPSPSPSPVPSPTPKPAPSSPTPPAKPAGSPPPPPAKPSTRSSWFGLPVTYTTQRERERAAAQQAQQEPVVRAFSGPSDSEEPPLVRAFSGPPEDYEEPAPRASPSPAPGAKKTTRVRLAGGPLQQKADAWLQQTFGELCGGDPSCASVKRAMWRMVVAGLWVHALSEGPGAIHDDVIETIEKIKELLPGDNPLLSKAQAWVEAHNTELRTLGGNLARMLDEAGVPVPDQVKTLLTSTATRSGPLASAALGPMARLMTGDGDLSNNALASWMHSSPLGSGLGRLLAGDGNPNNNALAQLAQQWLGGAAAAGMGLNVGAQEAGALGLAGGFDFMGGMGDIQRLMGEVMGGVAGTDATAGLTSGGAGASPGVTLGAGAGSPDPAEALASIFGGEEMQHLMESFLGSGSGGDGR